MEGKADSDTIIALVHAPAIDPNFLNMAARNSDELKAKAGLDQGRTLEERRRSLASYIEEAKQIAKNAPVSKSATGDGLTYEQKMVKFLEEKRAANEMLWEIYNGQADPEKEKAFFAASEKCWTEAVPNALDKLASGIKGPFVLGDQIVSD